MEKTSKYYERLAKLSSVELLCILHDCVDLLEPMSPSEMAKHECLTKKQILNRIELGKYMTFNFDDRKYPIMNDHRKNEQILIKNVEGCHKY